MIQSAVGTVVAAENVSSDYVKVLLFYIFTGGTIIMFK